MPRPSKVKVFGQYMVMETIGHGSNGKYVV